MSDMIHPMIIDSFAGGGGASTGIEIALGRAPDVAINHSAAALALHAANRWRAFAKDVQVSCCGNSVCPPLAAAIVGANCSHLSASSAVANDRTAIQ